MSEPLTNAAPTDETTVPPVGDTTAEPQGEVVEGSAPQGDVIPAARFNGLMGKFNQTQAELARTREELESLRAQTNKESQPVADSPDNSALQEQIAALTQMLTQERLEGSRRAALDEFPEAKPFADLIVANTPDELRDMARLISERVKSAGLVLPNTETESGTTGEPAGTEAAGTSAESGESTAPPEAPVTGGGTAFSGEAAMQDKVTDAIKNRDFAAYLRAKTELAETQVTEG